MLSHVETNANVKTEGGPDPSRREASFMEGFGGRIHRIKRAYKALSLNASQQDPVVAVETELIDLNAASAGSGFPEIAGYSAMILKVLAVVRGRSLSLNFRVLDLLREAIEFFDVVQAQAAEGKTAIASENSVVARLRSFEADLSFYREGVSVHKKVLVVDDDADIVRLLQIVLKKSGFSVSTAKNGQEALERLQAEVPDLVVLDVTMPGVTGFEVLEKIKTGESTRHLPVIMLTAKNNRDEIIRAVQSGAKNYVVKPFDSKELVARIMKLLGE